jgi:HD superfamily phosphohydrolase YqeK
MKKPKIQEARKIANRKYNTCCQMAVFQYFSYIFTKKMIDKDLIFCYIYITHS